MSTRTRRKRRQGRMHLRSKGRFKVGHKLKTGRTGQVAAKQRKAELTERKKRQPTPKLRRGRS